MVGKGIDKNLAAENLLSIVLTAVNYEGRYTFRVCKGYYHDNQNAEGGSKDFTWEIPREDPIFQFLSQKLEIKGSSEERDGPARIIIDFKNYTGPIGKDQYTKLQGANTKNHSDFAILWSWHEDGPSNGHAKYPGIQFLTQADFIDLIVFIMTSEGNGKVFRSILQDAFTTSKKRKTTAYPSTESSEIKGLQPSEYIYDFASGCMAMIVGINPLRAVKYPKFGKERHDFDKEGLYVLNPQHIFRNPDTKSIMKSTLSPRKTPHAAFAEIQNAVASTI